MVKYGLKLTALLAMIFIALSAHSATVSLEPETLLVSVGEQFAVDIVIDFSDEATLGGGIDIAYDSSIATFDSYSFDSNFLVLSDPLFTCPGAGSCIDIDQPDSVSNVAFGNFAGIGGNHTIGTLMFTMITEDTLFLTPSTTTGPAGPFVSALTFGVMNVDFNATSISAVPVPAAVWLLISGLGLFSVFRRKPK